MEVTTARRTGWPRGALAPATALVMLAVQVGSNASRDALFLSVFPVTTLPWFVAAAAVAAFPAALCASWLLAERVLARPMPGVG